MQLFSRDNLGDVPWPATPDGDYARRVLTPLVRDGVARYIANVDAEVRVLSAGGAALPLVIVNGRPRCPSPSYVCSPTTHYIDYAKREVELELHDRPALRRLLPLVFDSLRPLLEGGQIDRTVYVNNWLLSTNLYPAIPDDVLAQTCGQLVRIFPRHTLAFRSVNDRLNGELAAHLESLGFRRIFSRQVYVLDPRSGAHWKKKPLRQDLSLARRSPYHWEDAASLTVADCPRLKRLYDDLYIDKYSGYNPQFTEEFFRAALEARWLTFFVLKREGRIDGVLGYVERQGVITTPLIGYDRSQPPQLGLYRLIALKLVEEASERGLILHQSSGAAAFKRLRGSEPGVEYTFVYDRHLPLRRRLPWQLLAGLSRYVIGPLMRRWKL